jgi:hypothetical protein
VIPTVARLSLVLVGVLLVTASVVFTRVVAPVLWP